MKKNILIATPLYPPQTGGPATYTKILERELPQKDFEVSVVSFGSVGDLPKVVSHIVYFFKLLNKGRKADIIFALDPVSVGLPAHFAARILMKPLFLKVVGDYAWEQGTQRFGVGDTLDTFVLDVQKYSLPTRTLSWIERHVAKSAEKVIVPSAYLKSIVKIWGVPEERIKVIYNAFEPHEINESKEDIRKLLKFGDKVIISAGRLVPWKGFDTLIGIMPTLLRDLPDLKLFIAGDGPDHMRLSRLVTNLNLAGRVVLLGRLRVSDLSRYIKAADLFVLSTGYEGFSHQILEVMNVGTPVVTTNLGGNPELITNREDGLLVTWNDREALKSGIIELLENKELANHFALSAKEKVKQFSVDRMISELTSLLQ